MEAKNIAAMKATADNSFKNGEFQLAIDQYKEILQNDPNQPNIYQNIALCYKKLNDFKSVLQYSDEAIKLDSTYIKSYKLRGEAKVETAKGILGEEGISQMKDGLEDIIKAKALCKGQKKEAFEDELTHSTLVAKKILYYKDKEYKTQLRMELGEYLQEPIEKYSTSRGECEDLKNQLNEFLYSFEQEERKIPEFLTCPISCEIMIKPILLSSGHTYEKKEIDKHFNKNGYKDPLTGENVSATTIENINLRQAIEDFLIKNPWAYKHSEEDNYQNVSF